MAGRWFTAAWLFVTSSLAFSSVLVEEPFNYPDGPLVAVSGGIWKTHSGTSGQVEASDGRIHLSERHSEDVSLAFSSGPIALTNALTLYASVRVSFSALPSGAGTYFAHFKDASATTGFRSRIFALTNGAAAGAFRLGVAAGANAPSTVVEDDLHLNTVYLLVWRMALANNSTTLWLNPRGEEDPANTTSDEATPKAAVAFAFREAPGIGELDIDDLRAATRFEDLLAGVAPSIEVNPADQTVSEGAAVTFQVSASGTPPLAYQWARNGRDIPGATSRDLRLPRVTESDAGSYTVRVTNSFGAVASDPAALRVRPSSFRVAIECNSFSGVRLSWNANPSESYSVWVYDAVGEPPVLQAAGLVFADGAGQFEDVFSPCSSAFYQVCTP